MAYYYDDDYTSLSIGVIIAIAVACFISICVIPGFFFCLWMRRKSQLKKRNREGAEAYAAMVAQRGTQGLPFQQQQQTGVYGNQSGFYAPKDNNAQPQQPQATYQQQPQQPYTYGPAQ